MLDSISEACAPPVVCLFGVSGCGKSSVGRVLADALGAVHLDADEFHSSEAMGASSHNNSCVGVHAGRGRLQTSDEARG